MKSLPISLDRLLANPSFEQLSGKLVNIFEDETKVILELKGKKLRTLFGPFPETDLHSLLNKDIIAFVKEGEPIRIFGAKQVPKKERATTAAPGGKAESSTEKATHAPLLRWKKYAEGRPIGEPVKLSSMQRGFGWDLDFLQKTLRHLNIPLNPETKAIAYLDFRKVFHFISGPEFKAFLKDYRVR